jgi:hypothetical protein
MSQDDLTESGMKLGVEQSDVFLLVLTNRCLSRSYCLKEIGWALDADKKIICVFEDEARFWQWNFERWARNDCTRTFNEEGNVVWKNSPSLQVKYDDCPQRIKSMITEQYKNNTMLPYRRRNFESDSLLQQILVRSGELGCCWGQFEFKNMLRVPSTTTDTMSSVRRLLVISSLKGDSIAKQLKVSLVNIPGVALANQLDESTHAVLVLSEGIFKDESLTNVMAAITTLPEDRILMIYSASAGWLFYGKEHKAAPSPIQDLLNTHEAMIYRNADRYYEHTSMVYEIIKRLKSAQQKDSRTTNTTVSPIYLKESGSSPSAILTSNINASSASSPVIKNELFQASAIWEELRKLKSRVEDLEVENENLKSQLNGMENKSEN